MSSSEASFSLSIAGVAVRLGGRFFLAGMLTHKRVWRPRSAAIDAAHLLPLGRVFSQHRVQFPAIFSADEKRSMPQQARLTGAGLATGTYRNCQPLQARDKLFDLWVKLPASPRGEELRLALQVLGAAAGSCG